MAGVGSPGPIRGSFRGIPFFADLGGLGCRAMFASICHGQMLEMGALFGGVLRETKRTCLLSPIDNSI